MPKHSPEKRSPDKNGHEGDALAKQRVRHRVPRPAETLSLEAGPDLDLLTQETPSAFTELAGWQTNCCASEFGSNGGEPSIKKGGSERAATGEPEKAPRVLEELGSGERGHPRAIMASLSPGRPLEGAVRSQMQSAFGDNLSRVRVHTDAKSAELATRFNARAFTVGSHLVFGAGEFRPGTLVGDAIIAHELAHVIQQREAEANAPATDGQSELDVEADANRAVLDLARERFGSLGGVLGGFAAVTGARMRTGLRLQRCITIGKTEEEKTPEEKFAEVKEILSKAETSYKVAQLALDGDASRHAGNVAENLGKANAALTKIDDALTIYTAVQDFREFANKDPESDPEGFARSAGSATASLGKVMQLVPVLSIYGTFLAESGDFFVNMRRALVPEERKSYQKYKKFLPK